MKLFHSLWMVALTMVVASPAFAGQDRLLVAEKGEMRLSIFDPATGVLLGSVPEGGTTGHEVIASSDGKLAFVPIYGNSGVGKPGTDGSELVVVDLAQAKVIAKVDFGHGVRPHCPMIGPVDKKLYVTTELEKSVTIIDPKTFKIEGSIPTGQAESHMLVISHDGRFGYTANVGPGTVSVLDMIGRKTLKIIPIAGTTQRISISADDRWVFTSDQTKPDLVVIDTRTDTVKKRIEMPGLGYGSAVTPDGKFLLVAIPDKDVVCVIDLKTMQVARNVSVASDPQEVVISPDGKSAFVSCISSQQVVGVDLVNWRLSRGISTGKGPDGLAWAVEK